MPHLGATGIAERGYCNALQQISVKYLAIQMKQNFSFDNKNKYYFNQQAFYLFVEYCTFIEDIFVLVLFCEIFCLVLVKVPYEF